MALIFFEFDIRRHTVPCEVGVERCPIVRHRFFMGWRMPVNFKFYLSPTLVRLGFAACLLSLYMGVGMGFAGAAPMRVCEFSDALSPAQKNMWAAKIACEEHALWHQPYINGQGHLIHIGSMEAENDPLTDGTAAWRRVERYWWQGAGIEGLYRITDLPDASTVMTDNAIIRSRIVDTPWSGAFMAYIMRQAGMTKTEFAFEDGHIRYIKPAFATLASGYAYHTESPLNTRIELGDVLCYVRDSQRVYGVKGFFTWLSAHAHDAVSLKMHCDVVVGVKGEKAYAIGGNVAQAVTMRQLTLTSRGFLSKQHLLPVSEPMPSPEGRGSMLNPDPEAQCSPSNERGCDMNRKDWVVLLKYKKPEAIQP